MTVLMRRRKIADQGDLESVQFTMTAEDQLPELKIGQEVSIELRRGDQTGKGSLKVGEAP